MKKFWLTCAIVLTMGVSSCVDSEKDLRQDSPQEEINTSDFSTERTVQVEINYSNSNSRVPFFIYDKNPLTIGENTVTLDESIKPLDAAWTDEQGKYTGEMELPAYINDVYIVSKAFYARMLMKGKVANGILKVSDTDDGTLTRASFTSPVTYNQNRFAKLGWSTKLGTFDSRTGVINYVYEGKEPELTLTSQELADLRTTIYSVLDPLKKCPEVYRTAADLQVEKDNTSIVLTALGGWTCWNSSLGYYYYRIDNGAPKSLKDVRVYTVFPNTQTYWDSGSKFMSSPQGISAGTAVELKFFGDNGDETGRNFPKGYRIGFVLACNAWNTYFTGYQSHTQTVGYFSSSTKGLSSAGANKIDVHTAMFKDKKSGNIAITFEDFKDDQNFTDVLFSLKANPEIINVPEVDPDLNTTIEKTGIYAFEDLWPKAGDYDMNDVLVQYSYQKTFNIYNEILKESFLFKPLVIPTQAVYNNGFGFSINSTSTVSTEHYKKSDDTDEFTPTTFEVAPGNVIRLTNGVKTNPHAEYMVTVNYGKSLKKKQETTINAFIYRPVANSTQFLEVHCPMQAPTSYVDSSLFGTEDDRSVPGSGIYYVSNKGNVYPFAFYLSNATDKDIAPLLDPNNEKTPISELYPKFIDWAKNGTNANWYKQ